MKIRESELDRITEYENGVKTYPFLSLEDERVLALFTTRIGGVSPDYYGSLNLGLSTGDSAEHVRANFERLAEAIGISADQMVTAAQTHTKNIRIITAEDAGKGVTRPKDYANIDGLITNVPGICLTTSHADCNPVLLYDPVAGAIGAVHSGWMGTLQNITAEAVHAMEKAYGTSPCNLRAAIGPALCRDCFEVDLDVADRFLAAYPYLAEDTGLLVYRGQKAYIDLKGIIKRELVSLGLPEEGIEVSGLCTKEEPELFFSHRRSGTKRGLMAAAILLREVENA